MTPPVFRLIDTFILAKLKNLFTILSTPKAIGIIIIFGLVVFANSLNNGFVADDISQIVNNSSVHSISQAGSFFTNVTQTYFRPLMFLVFNFLYGIFGANPFPFHLVQVLLYIINAVLVYLFLKEFFDKGLALSLALIFVVHPMNAEAVIYISNLQEVLFFIFGISGLLLVINKRLTLWVLAALNLLFLAALLAKETAIIFVLLSLLFVFLYRKHDLLKILILNFLVLLEYIFLRFGIAHIFFTKPEIIPIARLSLLERLYNIPDVIWYYLRTFIFPKDLSIWQIWTIPGLDFNHFYLPVFIILLFGATIFLYGRKLNRINRNAYLAFIFFGSWLILGLGLHSQIVPLDNTVADRWFYLPGLGALGMLGVFISQLVSKKILSHKSILGFILFFVLMGLSVRTIIRNSNFRDEVTLYTHDSRVTDSAVLENLLGFALFQKGDVDAAGAHFEKSVSLAPYYWSYWNNLGTYYVAKNNFPRSYTSFMQADLLKSDPYLSLNEAGTLLAMHNYPETIALTNDLLKKHNLPQLWLVASVAEYKLGQTQIALKDVEVSNGLYPSVQASYLFAQIKAEQEIDDSYLIKSFLFGVK